MDCNDKNVSVFISDSDRYFLKTLDVFITSEKKSLCCPDKGPDEQRYIIYSAAFDKVIDYVTVYKPILTAIKKEYDDVIATVKNNARSARFAHGKLKAMAAQATTLKYYQMRAVQLQERITIIQRDTAEFQAEMKRFQDCKKLQEVVDDQKHHPVGQIPGLTLDELLDPAVLANYLEDLRQKRDELRNKKKSQYVPKQVKDKLDVKMRAILEERDELALDNVRLRLRYKQMTSLTEAIGVWEKSENRSPLLEFLTSEVERVSEIKVCEDDSFGFSVDEEDDPAKVREKKLLEDYIKRFAKLFEGGEYEAAALHAAKSPHGVLRNMETMERFQSVTVYEGELPPPLLYFQALMISAQPGVEVPEEALSVEGVRCALQHGSVELVTFWVTQHRLTYSEELGDVICSHGDEDPRVADTCLALAHIVYAACGVLRKAALSMCKRGMGRGALEFIYQNKDFTLDDCVFVVRGSPTLDLLQDFTQQHEGRAALLSLGFICHSLLNTHQEDPALQLLEKIYTDGQGALKKTVLDDEMCGAESWSEIATRCEQKNRHHLAREIISTLLSQDGAMCLSPGIESGRLMEHVFM